MLKFRSQYDSRSEWDNYHRDKPDYLSARNIPTVDEVNEVISPMTADTVLQILHGQAYYYGYDCERHCDNEIPNNTPPDVLEKELQGRFGIKERQRPEQRNAKIIADMLAEAERNRWQVINPYYRKAILLLARVRHITRAEAQKILLPQLLASEE